MKIDYRVDNPRYGRNQSHHIELWGYYNTESIIEDFEKILDYHQLKYEDYKSRYIKEWGEERWNKHVEAAKRAAEQDKK